jgi:hypothetical protein
MGNSMETKLSGADKSWGFRFGVDGVVSVRDAIRHLSIGRTKLYELFDAGLLRRGHVGTKVVICKRSMSEYLKTVEV